MSQSNPRFSIVIPTHLRPELLARCLGSVRRSSVTDFEIIVVSDYPDERSASIAHQHLSHADTYVCRPTLRGPAESRNFGLKIANGEYVLFLDDDDAILPSYLEEASDALSQFPGSPLYTNFLVIEENRESGEVLSTRAFEVAEKPLDQVWIKNFIHNHTVFYPRYVLSGLYQDASLKSLDDWDFLLQVMARATPKYFPITGAVIYKDYVSAIKRRGNSMFTEQPEHVIMDYLTVYRRNPAPSKQLRDARTALLRSMAPVPHYSLVLA